MAFSLICLTLSLVKSNVSPISSNVIACWLPKPKYSLTTSASLGVRVSKALSISVLRDSCKRVLSGLGDSPLFNTSYRFESSPSTRGASIETCLPEFFKDSLTSLMVMSSSLAISSAEGALSWACSKKAYVLLILLIDPILLSGKRTILDCSARACKID